MRFHYLLTVPSSQRRTQFSVVPDPENIEVNWLQLQYKGKAVTMTVGRQRINREAGAGPGQGLRLSPRL